VSGCLGHSGCLAHDSSRKRPCGPKTPTDRSIGRYDAAKLVYVDSGPKGIRSDMTGVNRLAQHRIRRMADIAVWASTVYDGIERARAAPAGPLSPFEAEAIAGDADAVDTSGLDREPPLRAPLGDEGIDLWRHSESMHIPPSSQMTADLPTLGKWQRRPIMR
jgi:hypothetical protein